jgi:starch phosphorylase
LDGWWDEAYDGTNGWAIGRGEEYQDTGYQDQIESQTLYQILESEVVPMFYARGRDGLPREWIRRMKHAMRTICPVFSAYRMVREYTERLYIPAGQQWERLGADGLARARAVAQWQERVRATWKDVAVRAVRADTVTPLAAGDVRSVEVDVALGALRPEDVSVSMYSGLISGQWDITSPRISDMKVMGPGRDGIYSFQGMLSGQAAGRNGFRIRILPAHQDLPNPLTLNCITWG